MMVADTSAFIAIVTNEPEREAFESVMAQDGDVLMSTASAVEFLIVAYARGDAVYQNALRILDQPLVTLIPLDEEQMHAAALAHQTYGRGHHSARLNFGDFPLCAGQDAGTAPTLQGRRFLPDRPDSCCAAGNLNPWTTGNRVGLPVLE